MNEAELLVVSRIAVARSRAQINDTLDRFMGAYPDLVAAIRQRLHEDLAAMVNVQLGHERTAHSRRRT